MVSPPNLFEDARLDDRRRLWSLDLARAAAGGLDSLDNPHRLLVGDLTEDDVLAIKPFRLDSGDEELGAVATRYVRQMGNLGQCTTLRIRASVGHREKTRLGVLFLEVLIGEFLTVDGLSTGALLCVSFPRVEGVVCITYIATSKVSTLEHEVWDHTMEL